MKLSDIITNTNPKLDTWVDINDLAAEFGINDTFYGSQDRITCRFFQVWQCTDTWVGGNTQNGVAEWCRSGNCKSVSVSRVSQSSGLL